MNLNKLAEILQNADDDDLEEELEEKTQDDKSIKKKKGKQWKGQDKFTRMLKDCKHPSKTKIRSIAEFSLKHAKWYKTIVYLIKKQLQKMPEKQSKLSILFIIDAICRLARQKLGKNDNFRKRFTPHLREIFSLLCKGPSKDRGDIKRVVAIWKSKKFFQSTVLNPIIKKTASFPDSKKRKRRHSESSKEKRRSDNYDYGDLQDDMDLDQLRNRRRQEEKQRRSSDHGEPARKRRRVSESPQASPPKHVTKRPSHMMSSTKSSYDSTLGGSHMIEHAPYQSSRSKVVTKGYLITKDQSQVPEGFVRVMSTTLWLGRRDMDDRADQTIKKLVGKFGEVHDVSFREDHVFVKYKHRDDASRAHQTLTERLVGSSNGKKFTVGWGKPPKVTRQDFDFERGIGLMPLEDIKMFGISAPQTDEQDLQQPGPPQGGYSNRGPYGVPPPYQDPRTRREYRGSPADTRTQDPRRAYSPDDTRTRRDSPRLSPDRRDYRRRSRSPRRRGYDRRDRSPDGYDYRRRERSPRTEYY